MDRFSIDWNTLRTPDHNLKRKNALPYSGFDEAFGRIRPTASTSLVFREMFVEV